MAQLFSNNAVSKLASGISDVATSLTLSTGTGSLFPSPTGGDYFLITLYSLSGYSEINHEIIKVTARSGDVLTVTRAQESTTARTWATDTPVELRSTAAALNNFASKNFANTFTADQTISTNSSSTALTITQTGSGNCFVVEDSASTDSTPFVIDSAGNVGIGKTPATALDVYNSAGASVVVSSEAASAFIASRYSSDANAAVTNIRKYRGTSTVPLAVATGDSIGFYRFSAYGGSNTRVAAQMEGVVEQYTSDTNLSAYLRWSTTSAGTSPVEKMRLDASGKLTIGSSGADGTNASIYNSRSIKGSTLAAGYYTDGLVSSEVTITAAGLQTALGTTGTFTLLTLVHFYASQRAFDVNSTVTSQYGFLVDTSLIGATNNYGFYSNIDKAAGRWNFYANGAAANYFAGDMQLGKTVTAAGTTGNQTIDKTIGSVNFAAGATSLVVTNNLVTANSIITATVAANDTTMKSVAVVASSGSFTLYANAAATAETRVNFHVFN